VVATAHGREVLAERDTRLARAEQHLLAGLTPDEQASFRALLVTLAAHVNDLDPVLTACEAVEDITASGAP
jgi:DNA-binding MarR family transcriptional regulator